MHALSRSSNQEESLSFLFMLADCQLGRAYPINALTKSQRQMMFELYKIGLIYIRDVSSSKRFYPTHAAVDMLFRTTRTHGRVNETVGMLSRCALARLEAPFVPHFQAPQPLPDHGHAPQQRRWRRTAILVIVVVCGNRGRPGVCAEAPHHRGDEPAGDSEKRGTRAERARFLNVFLFFTCR